MSEDRGLTGVRQDKELIGVRERTGGIWWGGGGGGGSYL